MPLQPPDFVGNLDPNDPRDTDSRTISDDYHRMIQESCRMTTPNYTGEVTATHQDTNLLSGYTTNGVKPMPGEGGVTTIFHYGSTAWTGWTITEPDTNLRELIIGPSASGGTIGGTDNPTSYSQVISISGVTGGSTIGTGQISISGTAQSPASGDGFNAASGGNNVTRFTHSHSVSGSNNANVNVPGQSFSDTDTAQFTPRYARGILIQLDI